MADTRRYGVLPVQPELALRQILQEAQHRWLRPTEVCEILRNYGKFTLTPDPPQKPQGGSLFLFDRKALRYFRKDGHNWRKKKDGKTVREAHERLKAGSIDVLHCYYAHGEDNENFQRRSYWMLEGAYENIVLVHYREVKEGYRVGAMRSVNGYSTDAISSQTCSLQGAACIFPTSSPQNSPLVSPHASPGALSPNTAGWNGHKYSPDYDEQDSGDDLDQCPLPELDLQSGDRASVNSQLNGRLEDMGPSLRTLQACASFSSRNSSSVGVNKQLNSSLYNTQCSSIKQQGILDLGTSQGLSVNEGDNILLQRWICGSDNLFSSTTNPLSTPGGFNLREWNDCLKRAKCPEVTGGYGVSENQVLGLSTWNALEKCSTIQHNPIEAMTSSSMIQSYNPIDPKFQTGNFHSIQGPTEVSLSNALGRELHTGTKESQQGLALTEACKTSAEMISESSSHLPPVTSDRPNLTQQINGQHHSNGSDWKIVFDQLGDNGHRQSGLVDVFCSDQVSWTQSHEPKLQLHNKEHLPQQQLEQNQNAQQHNPFPQDETGTHNGSNIKDSNLLHCYSEMPKDYQANSASQQEECGSFKKLDSFGRWMNQEIGGDVDNSLLTVSSDSTTYWRSTLDDQSTAEEVTSLSQQMQFDVGLSLSLSQEQCFSIIDFSPDHAESSAETKVLVTGVFLETLKDPSEYRWCCMFGEIEVPAELLLPGVLRCKAPPHAPGRVPFYVTRNDRSACSEVRDFEYYADSDSVRNAWTSIDSLILEQQNEDMLFQVRLARMLSSNFNRLSESQHHEGTAILSSEMSSLTLNSDGDWSEMEDSLKQVSHLPLTVKEQLVQRLLKDRTHDWILRKIEEHGKGASVLNENGLGVLHMAAALGYDWMIAPVLAASVNINFRDARGWTALHWAAFCGREKAVVALLAAGADPGAKTDPNPKFPAGQTPADLASSRRHKGIAGYLAESALTSHLSLLTLQDSMMGNMSAALAGERAVETIVERTSVQLSAGACEDRLALQDSLAAVRNAAQAAARIQASFRVHSFRKRQEACKDKEDEYGISDDQARSIVAAQRGHKSGRIFREEVLHDAAVRIQRKYRGWKGRRDFLLFRQRIVRLQAHVRGHQVRKNYNKILWTVGIVEKAILRWRRKGKGLRGFCADITSINGVKKERVDSDEDDDFLKIGRKQTEAGLEKALSRVQSMVKSREARDQYRRLLESYKEAKVNFGGNTYDASCSPTECSQYSEDFFMSITDQ